LLQLLLCQTFFQLAMNLHMHKKLSCKKRKRTWGFMVTQQMDARAAFGWL